MSFRSLEVCIFHEKLGEFLWIILFAAMEIETINLERWMCRVCFSEGTYNIFEDQLAPLLKPSTDNQGHYQLASKFLLIVDALNCFSEFKVKRQPYTLCEMFRCLFSLNNNELSYATDFPNGSRQRTSNAVQWLLWRACPVLSIPK